MKSVCRRQHIKVGSVCSLVLHQILLKSPIHTGEWVAGKKSFIPTWQSFTLTADVKEYLSGPPNLRHTGIGNSIVSRRILGLPGLKIKCLLCWTDRRLLSPLLHTPVDICSVYRELGPTSSSARLTMVLSDSLAIRTKMEETVLAVFPWPCTGKPEWLTCNLKSDLEAQGQCSANSSSHLVPRKADKVTGWLQGWGSLLDQVPTSLLPCGSALSLPLTYRLRFLATERCWVAGPWAKSMPGTTGGVSQLLQLFHTLLSGEGLEWMENVSRSILANSISVSPWRFGKMLRSMGKERV